MKQNDIIEALNRGASDLEYDGEYDKAEQARQFASDLSKGLTLTDKLMKVIEILKTPESSDDIWWCVGELETIVKDFTVPKVGA